ncbi:hypothetical protein JHK87_004350 [Glycine soja]|nr:hypothetical protein JHK87_004350 [Glycine soja]
MEFYWGFRAFIPIDELCDPSNGFIVNDTCLIEVENLFSQSEHLNLNLVEQPVSKIYDKAIEHTADPIPKEMCTTSLDEFVDFRGLGKIEKSFVPLLEDLKRKREENVTALAMKEERLKKKMKEIEAELGIARRDLVQAGEDFEACNLDAEVGYGRP